MQSFRGSWLVGVWQLSICGCLWMCSAVLLAQESLPQTTKPYWMTADLECLLRADQTESKLNQRVTFDFKETPLSEVVKVLAKQVETAFNINEVELDSLGLTVDQPITAANRAVTLQEALKQILNPLDLDITIHESDIEISSKDSINAEPVTKVYDLAHVIRDQINVDELALKLSQIVDPDEWRDYGGTGDSVLIPFGSALVVSAPTTTHRGLVKVLANVAQTPSYVEATAGADGTWKTGKSLTLSGSAMLGTSTKQSQGSIALPEGATYDLLQITQQPANAPPANGDSQWTKPEVPAPAWLQAEPIDNDDSEVLRQKLRQVINADCNGVPLTAALTTIFKPLDVTYWIDEAELDTLGITSDALVHLQLQNSSAHSVLKRFLSPLDLTYSIQGNSVKITSTDGANNSPTTRFYDMSALSSKPFDMRTVMFTIASTVTPDEWRDWGGAGNSSLIPFGSKLCVTAPEATLTALDGLLCQIATIHPDNLPKVEARQNIKIETVISGIPGGSTIQIPENGIYQLRRN